ncbi:hemopexin repeat-containing protein [Kibdelosporangium lantanae]|uniref:Hemopexin repeat-containing protein n=1 Tax=Kibdelosporangium lantanae TaxID=1497396 RepID=A0ABW3MDL0_9PSEU
MIGRVRNTIATTGKVDAALVAAGRTFLFSGDQYVRYSEGQYQGDYKYVDDGYPRTIASSLPAELDMAELPEQFHTGIDAAFASPDGRVYLFRGPNFLRSDESPPVVRPIAGTWGVVSNEFADGSPGSSTRESSTPSRSVVPSGLACRLTSDRNSSRLTGPLEQDRARARHHRSNV